jgi:hypothetical protein
MVAHHYNRIIRIVGGEGYTLDGNQKGRCAQMNPEDSVKESHNAC